MTEETEVAVVGGGLAGLAAAHTLHKRGVPFVLLEASPRFGGLIRTERIEGFLLEGGPDTILATKPDGIALCRELGLTDRLVPTNPTLRTVYVLHRGRLHPLPEGMVLTVPTRLYPLLRTGLLSWPGKLRMVLEAVLPRRKDDADESLGAFLRRRFGEEAALRLSEPLLGGIHAGDPARLSLRATFPRLAEMEARYGSLIRGMRKAPIGASAEAPAVFFSLTGGLGELVDALVASVPAAALRASSPVRIVGRSGGGFQVEVQGGPPLSARSVIVALPPSSAAVLLRAVAPEVSRELEAIPSASSAAVLLAYRRPDVRHPLDGFGLIVLPTENLRTTACTFLSTKLPGRAPAGHVLLRAFVGGVRDPQALALSDAALVETVHGEMQPVLGLSRPPVLSRVYRWPSARPQMEVGHLERVARIDAGLAEVPGLFLTAGGLRGTGIPDVTADAVRTAAGAAAWAG